ncbi:YqgE/AlgH family protein [Cellulomonas sp. KH9]|uniref:YqgE/AlgH family protein n=1 Tax=Cellulomonas sp. KH9 TaxID=1855324 RepID=UPI0008DF704D|nr:YqgE/AlgH family protein [Cellulomonas sp. KH9]SFK28448.1 putative transcriptional regulator [Cellulomonas sp. KH9]
MEGCTGRLLVAAPGLRDRSFRRSVVLVLEHAGEGALGVVLDHPLEVDATSVLPQWQPHLSMPSRLFQGGPVARDTALALADVADGETPPGVRHLGDRLAVVDLDAPPVLVVDAVRALRVFIGYAGWSAGQLDEEIEAGGWFVVEHVPGDVFTPDPGGLWRRVLRRQPGDLALLSTAPDDASLN